MTSIYYPAHVYVLFKRLVNVVGSLGTLSLSEHCLAQRHRRIDEKEWTKEAEVVKNVEKREGGVLRATLDLPKWFPQPGTWSLPSLGLFSFQPQLDPDPGQNRNDNDNDNDDESRSRSSSSRKDDKNDKKKKGDGKEKKEEIPFYNPETPLPPDIIHQLIANPALYDPLRTPRYPIVLCHGLYGFDSRGPSSWPSLRMHYWSNVLRILRGKLGAEVIVTGVPGTGSIPTRASSLHQQLLSSARGRGVNLLAHSMGGLDGRHLISHIRPDKQKDGYVPLSLTSVCTPHRGSPFMDWCTTNIGIGKLRQQEKDLKEELRRSSSRDDLDLSHSDAEEDECYDHQEQKRASSLSGSSSTSNSDPPSSSSSSLSLSSLTSLSPSSISQFPSRLLSLFDSPAYSALTSHYLGTIFNPSTPDSPNVKYWSVASRLSRPAEGGTGMVGRDVGIFHPFWLSKGVVDGWEEEERRKVYEVWQQDRERKAVAGNTAPETGEDGQVPVWADPRMWGNDGLVTVQSAKWGEFLGIVEGADHWEMRGARGIEFGVDLPAIPAIGLGEELPPDIFGEAGSRSEVGGTSSATSQARQTGGDGWGFGDWTKFVGAWMASGEGKDVKEGGKEQGKGEREGDKTTTTKTKTTSEITSTSTNKGEEVQSSKVQVSTSMSTDAKADDKAKASATPDLISTADRQPETKREERTKDSESSLKSSTEKISVVFDWLVERVPGNSSGSAGGVGDSKENEDKLEVRQTKELERDRRDGSEKEKTTVEVVRNGEKQAGEQEESMAMYHVGASGSRSSPPTSSTTHSSSSRGSSKAESKPTNELATRKDLERFYISLARKMYDAGL